MPLLFFQKDVPILPSLMIPARKSPSLTLNSSRRARLQVRYVRSHRLLCADGLILSTRKAPTVDARQRRSLHRPLVLFLATALVPRTPISMPLPSRLPPEVAPLPLVGLPLEAVRLRRNGRGHRSVPRSPGRDSLRDDLLARVLDPADRPPLLPSRTYLLNKRLPKRLRK